MKAITQFLGFVASAVILSGPSCVSAAETLFAATPLTEGEFTELIEGPACDRDGNIYCVAFRHARNIARVTPEGKAELFLELPGKSWGNGIRFNPAGDMFIADYTGHNVLRVDMKTKAISVFAHNATMNQPNDLAIAPDGTLYASDPNWKNNTGQLWRITKDGQTHREAADMGTSNGSRSAPTVARSTSMKACSAMSGSST